MRMGTELPSILLAALLAITMGAPEASAQKYGSTPPNPIQRDWTLAYDFDLREEFRLKRAPMIGYTQGDRVKSGLEISRCDSAESVKARLEPDPLFDIDGIPKLPNDETLQTAYLFIPGASKTWQISLEAGYTAWHFDLPRKPAEKGASARICPVDNSSDARCLNFSLKGFSAALRRVCAYSRAGKD